MSARSGRHVDGNRWRCRLVGGLSWLAILVLLEAALQHDGTPAATMLALGPTALMVTYGLTLLWVWHAKVVWRRRPQRVPIPYGTPWMTDRLGRDLTGSIGPACGSEIVLSVDGSMKVYRRC